MRICCASKGPTPMASTTAQSNPRAQEENLRSDLAPILPNDLKTLLRTAPHERSDKDHHPRSGVHCNQKIRAWGFVYMALQARTVLVGSARLFASEKYSRFLRLGISFQSPRLRFRYSTRTYECQPQRLSKNLVSVTLVESRPLMVVSYATATGSRFG